MWGECEALIFTEIVPLGDLPAGVFADLLPVGGTRGAGAVQPQGQAAHHLVLGGAVEVDHHKLYRDLRQQLRGHVVDEGLVEDRIERALLYVRLLLGNALTAVEHVDFHIGVWGRQ